MQRLEVSGAVRTIYGSLGVKRLKCQGSSDHIQSYALDITFEGQCGYAVSPNA